MKKNILIVCAIFSLVSIVFASCEQDRCKTRGTICLNKGTCFDGVCNCPVEFEGDSCNKPVSLKFENVYGGIRVNPGKQDSDDTLVVSMEGNNKIRFFSRYRPLLLIHGTIKNNEVLINETVAAVDGYTYKGSGSLNGLLLSLTMHADSLYMDVPQKSIDYTFAGTKTK
jgi:hypothetical protein